MPTCIYIIYRCVCCCLVAQMYLTLCNPMKCSMPGFPVLHCLCMYMCMYIFKYTCIFKF